MTKPCAVYRVWAAEGGLLYIGCSPTPDVRLQEHKQRVWASDIANMTCEWFESKAEALKAEAAAIRAELPEWNVNHRPNPKRDVGRYSHDFRRDDRSTWVRA